MTTSERETETLHREIRDLKHRLTMLEARHKSADNRYSEAYVKAETRRAASEARQDFALWLLVGITAIVIIVSFVLFNILIIRMT